MVKSMTRFIATMAAALFLVGVSSMSFAVSSSAKSVVAPITKAEVLEAQHAWAKGLVNIGKVHLAKGNYKKTAGDLIHKLYAYSYEQGSVLFKPTKAAEHPFRGSFTSALSYFVGSNKDFSEDKGFALAPWKKIVFHNDEIYLHGDMAIAMGEYYFTDMKNTVTKVEYTFGYVKTNKGQLKIVLHHSSLPFGG